MAAVGGVPGMVVRGRMRGGRRREGEGMGGECLQWLDALLSFLAIGCHGGWGWDSSDSA